MLNGGAGEACPSVHKGLRMSTQDIQRLEAKRTAVIQKLMTKSKKPTWNVPDEISLVPDGELVVGRCPGKSMADSKAIILHSAKLPSMLSRRHAQIKYDMNLKQWTITDLKVKLGILKVYVFDIV